MSAILPAVGVILGALIGFWGQYAIATRQRKNDLEDREREIQERRRDQRFQRVHGVYLEAIRAVDELLSVNGLLLIRLELGGVSPSGMVPTPDELKDQAWRRTRAFHAAMAALRLERFDPQVEDAYDAFSSKLHAFVESWSESHSDAYRMAAMEDLRESARTLYTVMGKHSRELEGVVDRPAADDRG